MSTIDRAGERLVVHLTEAPVLDRVAFEGNKKIKDKDLDAVVESKPRGTLQRATVQADVGRIIEAYRHAGRDDVSVVPEIIDRGNDRVDLVYDVTEGGKTTVRQINFVGNTRLRQAAARRRDQDLRHQYAELSDRRRRLRSRPRRRRSRACCGCTIAARAMPTPA